MDSVFKITGCKRAPERTAAQRRAKPLLAALLLIALLAPLHLLAQQPWNFASLEDACLDDAFLVQPPAEICGKVTQQAFFPDKDGATVEYNSRYHISGPYRHPVGMKGLGLFSKTLYVRLQNERCDLYLPQSLAAELLPYLISCSYWEQRFRRLLRWTYVVADTGQLLEVDSAGILCDKYAPLTWIDYSFQPSERYPVVFSVRTNTPAT